MNEDIGTVTDYLKTHYPDASITGTHAFDRSAHTYIVKGAGKSLVLTVSLEFLRDRSPVEIRTRLDDDGVGTALEGSGPSTRHWLITKTETRPI